MKKFISAAALGVAVAGVFAVSSCSGGTRESVTIPSTTTAETPTTTTTAEKVAAKYLKNYIFDQEGKAVSSNLSLPATLTYKTNEYALDWSSDNAAITVAKAEDGKTYVGTLNRPSTERATVTLTAKLTVADDDTAEAKFVVYVNPYDVYEIADAFKFAYNKGVVYTDFEVPTTTHYAEGIDATISWAVVGENQPLAVSEDGKTIKVTQQETRTKVQLEATFTYNNTSTKTKYEFSVYKERNAEELFYAYYDEATKYGEAFTVRGYVVAKAGYTESYGNGYVYVQDQTGLGGYYIYRCMIENKALWDSLEVGTRVEVPMVVATIYNGLYESTDNKKTYLKVITDDAVLAPLDKDGLAKLQAGVAIDNDVVAASADLKYQTGNLVSLTSWKVVSVGSVSATSGGTALTLEKNGVQITLQISKYGVDLGTNADAPTTADKIVAAVKEIKAGDFVNVKGILNNNKGYYVMAVGEDCVKKTTDDNGASTYEAASPAAALAKVELETAYVSNTEIDLSTIKVDGVTLSVEIPAEATSAKYDAATNKIIITPNAELADGEKVTIKVIAKNGKYTAEKSVETLIRVMTPAEMLAYENENFSLGEITKPGKYDLSATGQTYKAVEAIYEITEGDEFAEFEAGKLVIGSVDGDTTVKVKVTLSAEGQDPVEKTFDLAIKNPTVTVKTPYTALEDGKAYDFCIVKDGVNYYSTGAVASSYYIGLTDDASAGYNKIYAEKDGTAFKLYFLKSDNSKIYITASVSNGKGSLGVTTDASKATKTFKLVDGMPYITSSSEKWVLSSSGTYKNFGLYKQSAISSSYQPVVLGTSEDYVKTREEKVAFEKAKLTTAKTVYELTTDTLSTKPAVFEDVTISYALKEAYTGVTLVNDVLTFDGVNEDTTVIVVATLTCNGKTATQEITYTVKDVASYMTPTEIITAATASSPTIKSGDAIAVTGVAYFDASGNLWLTDGTSDFEVYKPLTTGAVKLADIKPGDVVSIVGTYTVYNGTHETNGNTAQLLVKAAATDDQKLAVTAHELALPETITEAKEFTLAAKGTIFTDCTIAWSLGAEYETATLADGKLSITPSTTKEEKVVVKATITLGENTPKVVTFTITVEQNSAEKVSTLVYSSSDSVSLKADSDDFGKTNWAESLGLKATIFDVKFTKNSGSATALYKDSIRLYGNTTAGNVMTITAVEGYKIKSITITYDTSKTGAVAIVNSNALTAVSTDHTTDNVTIDGNTITIANNTSSQLRIASIVIEYTDLNFKA